LWESRSPPDIIIKRSYSLTSVMGLAPFLFGIYEIFFTALSLPQSFDCLLLGRLIPNIIAQLRKSLSNLNVRES